MRVDELDELSGEDAESAIAELVSTSNVPDLARIAQTSHSDRLALQAIEGLADVGGAEATDALIELLQDAAVPRVIWGTEQEREHERRQAHLLHAVARARGVAPPAGRSEQEIAEFIESIREG